MAYVNYIKVCQRQWLPTMFREGQVMFENEKSTIKSSEKFSLPSFYASVECMERGLDPMTTNLVVADLTRTEKTICLAVSPSLKAYGIPGRTRLFDVIRRVKDINAERKNRALGYQFTGSSADDTELKENPSLELDYITAPPRMALYMDYSSRIYEVYLKYIAPEDIHVYSIDEVMMDVTGYLNTYGMTARELAAEMILDVQRTTGVTAAAGSGTNLYLCKVAMDIEAKHIPPDENGVRIAELDEMSYRRLLWSHRPLTDFWRVGRGYAKKLEEHGLFTMGDIARCSLGKDTDYYNEDLLYQMFGINAELLTASRVADESEAAEKDSYEQLDLFTDQEAAEKEKEQENQQLEKEKRWQKAMLDIKKKYGKNAILRGMNLEEGATARERNNQIGGHKA